MKQLSLEERRRRIDNLCSAEKENHRYFRRHRIHEYLPGQVIYHLGDYPSYYTTEPTDYDREMIQELAENGAGLIQLHEDWNDPTRHFGADKFSSVDPEGLHHFIDLCHDHDLKIIPYISTGYFPGKDPDFNENFTRSDCNLTGGTVHLRLCYSGSEYWCNYLLPRTIGVLDKYAFDGIYNDMGNDAWSLAWRKARAEGKDQPEFPYEPEMEDLLSAIYGEIKRRGGIYKLHANKNDYPVCKDKVYDYLWIGEGTADTTPGVGKDYPDYIVPCPDFNKVTGHTTDYHFVRTIPFMQFPLLTRGRPYHGNLEIDGLELFTPIAPNDRYAKIRKYMEEHPDGPYVYSEWSPIPDDPMYYTLWKKYLKLYKPMVEENSVVFMELRETEEILSPLPAPIIASMFINEEKYLVISNLSDTPYTLELRDEWINRETDEKAKSFTLAPETILFLKKTY